VSVKGGLKIFLKSAYKTYVYAHMVDVSPRGGSYDRERRLDRDRAFFGDTERLRFGERLLFMLRLRLRFLLRLRLFFGLRLRFLLRLRLLRFLLTLRLRLRFLLRLLRFVLLLRLLFLLRLRLRFLLGLRLRLALADRRDPDRERDSSWVLKTSIFLPLISYPFMSLRAVLRSSAVSKQTSPRPLPMRWCASV